MTKSFNYYDCVMPLLKALGWNGHARRIFEAVPYLIDKINLTDLRNIMANLGFTSKGHSLNLRDIPMQLMPCLFVAKNGNIYILKDVYDGAIQGIDCRTNQPITLPSNTWMRGTAYTFYQQPEEAITRGSWLSRILSRFHSFIYWLMGLGFLTSVLSLSSIVFVMAVYDEVVPTRSELTRC